MDLQKFLDNENRFSHLKRVNPERAETLRSALNTQNMRRHDKMSRLGMDDLDLLDSLKEKVRANLPVILSWHSDRFIAWMAAFPVCCTSACRTWCS